MAKGQEVKYPSARLKGLGEFMVFVQDPTWKPTVINAEILKKGLSLTQK